MNRGDISLIVEFGACLNEWKQSKRAPLLERKLAMRKELDRLMEISRDKTEATAEMTQLRADLADLQKRLDEARKRDGKGNKESLCFTYASQWFQNSARVPKGIRVMGNMRISIIKSYILCVYIYTYIYIHTRCMYICTHYIPHVAYLQLEHRILPGRCVNRLLLAGADAVA